MIKVLQKSILLITFAIIIAGLFGLSYAIDQTTGTEVLEQAVPEEPVTVEVPSMMYSVGIGDILSINIKDSPEFSGNFPVHDKGWIMYPMLGEIKAAGLTLLEIEAAIKEKLEKEYLYDPVVNISINRYGSRKVEILGGMGNPGAYYISGTTRLFDLFIRAHMIYSNYGENMKGRMVRILRKGAVDGKTEKDSAVLLIDLFKLLVDVDDEANIYLQDGDIIYVPGGTAYIYVVGEVMRPGSFTHQMDMTVLKAITLAGGPTKAADVNNTFVKRIINDKEVVKVKVEMPDVLQPEDIVEVPLSFW